MKSKIEQIVTLDKYFQENKPTELVIKKSDTETLHGRFIYSKTPGGLYK